MKKYFYYLVILCSFLLAVVSTACCFIWLDQLLPEQMEGRALVVAGLGYLLFSLNADLTIILHELGHAFCGWLTGFDLVALGLGNWLLLKKERGWQWKKTVIVKGAAAQYIGVKKDKKDTRMELMFAGGLLVHLTLMGLFLLVGLVTRDWLLVGWQVGLNLALFLFNAYPEGMTDGAKLWDLRHYPETAEICVHSLDHTAQIMLAPEEADLRDLALDLPILPGHIAQSHYLNRSEILLFDGELEEARRRLEALLDQSDNSFICSSAKTILLAIALVAGEDDRARELGQDKQVKAFLGYPLGNCQAIAALYYLRITKNKKALHKAMKQARKSLPHSPMLRDERAYYSQMVERVEAEAVQEGLLASS